MRCDSVIKLDNDFQRSVFIIKRRILMTVNNKRHVMAYFRNYVATAQRINLISKLILCSHGLLISYC